MRRIASSLSLSLLLAACSSSTPPVDAGNAMDTAPATDAAPDDTGSVDAAMDVAEDHALPPVDAPGVDVVPHMLQTSIGPITLQPGEEHTWCVLQRLGNDVEQGLRRVRAHLGDASHHLILYRSNETTEQRTPFLCNGFSGVQSVTHIESPLIIAQQREAELDMPAGVGMRLGVNQMVRIELHAINVTSAPITLNSTVDLDTVDLSTGITPADVMFWGPTDISIPPHSTGEIDFFHIPWASSYIFALTSHTHHFGTLATVSTATQDATGTVTDLTELHRSTSWSEPPLTTFATPLHLPAGQGLHLVCHYNNTSDQTVTFGESAATDEMCFMWAYYYPGNRGTQICATTRSYNDGGVVCYPP